MGVQVDKVADEVTGTEVVQVTDMKIPIKDLTDVTLAIGDTYRDQARSGWQVVRHVELMPPGCQIFK